MDRPLGPRVERDPNMTRRSRAAPPEKITQTHTYRLLGCSLKNHIGTCPDKQCALICINSLHHRLTGIVRISGYRRTPIPQDRSDREGEVGVLPHRKPPEMITDALL